nr:NAD(P)-dependent oxidoreductase [Cohnella lubricantis]
MVTGAGGYIGSVLVPKLLGKGYEVVAVDRYFFGQDKLHEHENLTVVQEDTRRMGERLFEDVDAVIDLVGISNDPSGELFQEATYQINYLSRVNTARLARKAGVAQYILPSSCSVYGFQDPTIAIDELSPTNPLTTYARANEKAEQEILSLASPEFTVTVLRQATVFGYSPRMRFDLVLNSMTLAYWEKGVFTINRDGLQWRPFVHVQDTADVMCLLLTTDPELINGQVFNVGSNENNYQMLGLAKAIATALGTDLKIEWYGEPDHRSYRVNFDKLRCALNWKPARTVADGVLEIYDALVTGTISKQDQTVTLKWYQEMMRWHRIIKQYEMYGGILNIT